MGEKKNLFGRVWDAIFNKEEPCPDTLTHEEYLLLLEKLRYENAKAVEELCVSCEKRLQEATRAEVLLKEIEVQSPELCEEAVKQNPEVLQYIKNQTPEMVSLAISEDEQTLV